MTTPAPKLHMFYVPGTGESNKSDKDTTMRGMGLAFAQQSLGSILGQESTPAGKASLMHWVSYDASIGPAGGGIDGQSHRDSREIGKRNLKTALLAFKATNPNDGALLVGYSQGAGVVWEFVQEMYAGLHEEIRGLVYVAAYIANPYRPKEGGRNQGVHLNDENIPLKGWGVANRHGTSSAKTKGPDPDSIYEINITNPKDVIGNADGDSFVRGIADLVEFFEFEDLIGWATKTLRAAQTFDWSTEVNSWLDLPRLARRIDKAFYDIQGYLTGQHTRAYTDGTFYPVGPNKVSILEDIAPMFDYLFYCFEQEFPTYPPQPQL